MRKQKHSQPSKYEAGMYLVTPPVAGGINKFVGHFGIGDAPREIKLPSVGVKALEHSPFKLQFISPPPEKAPDKTE